MGKVKRINKYTLIDISTTVVYCLILYFGFTWLAGFSLLAAYIWNFALIVIVVIFETTAMKSTQSDETIAAMKEKYGTQKAYAMMAGDTVSFKVLVYLFYLFILIALQVVDVVSVPLSDNFIAFIHANNYSIMFLLGLDILIKQLSEDKQRRKKTLEKYKEFGEKNDE